MDNGEENYARFINGDNEGLAEIVRIYKDGLTLYINRIVGNIFTAEELMQETFFRLIMKKPKFKGKSSFKTWLYTIGRNIAYDYLRKNSRITEITLEAVKEEADVEAEYIKNEEQKQIFAALDRLNEQYRQIIYLKYIEGFDNPELASILKKNKRQIENSVSRAKAALKNELMKEGFDYEELP